MSRFPVRSIRNLAATALLAVAATTLVPASPARAKDEKAVSLRLVYSYVLERTDEADLERKTPLVPRTEGTVEVHLGQESIAITARGHRRVLDFAKDMEYVIDESGETYQQSSLVAGLAGLQLELRNRIRMGKMLASMEKNTDAFAPVELAALFGWRPADVDAGTAADLAIADGGGTLKTGDRVLAQWTASEHVLPRWLRSSFARFLHYHLHPHPQARDAMANGERVPARIVTRWRNVGESDVLTMTLTSARVEGAHPVGVEGLTRGFRDDPLGELARRALIPGEGVPGQEGVDKRIDQEGFRKLAADARAAGRYEDCLLLLLECGLQSGDGLREDFRALLTDEQSAARAKSLIEAIALANSAPETALKSLDEVDRDALTHPLLLDVFRANAIARLKRLPEARDLFVAALTKHTWLAAAYKDLGDICYAALDVRATWLCWEIGRAISPQHSIWKPVDAYEESLRTTFAELL